MNILDIITLAGDAGREFSAGKSDDEIRAGVEQAAKLSYDAELRRQGIAIVSEMDWWSWRLIFGTSCHN